MGVSQEAGAHSPLLDVSASSMVHRLGIREDLKSRGWVEKSPLSDGSWWWLNKDRISLGFLTTQH